MNFRYGRDLLVALLLLTACTRQAAPPPTAAVTPVATPAFAPRGGGVMASGALVPVQKAVLSFPTTGRVQLVAGRVSDQVDANTVVMVLEHAAVQAAVAQAQATLFQAQAHLAEVTAGARPQEIAMAQANLETMQAQLAQITEPTRAEEVTAARAEVAAAQAALQQLANGPREEERIAALATLSNAKAALQRAQSAYNKVSWANDIGARPESQQLQEATNNYEAAQARYDALFAGPDADQSAAARAQVQQAQANLERLLRPGSASAIAAAEAQVRSAQANLDLLTAAARDETIAAAAAAVTAAEAALQQTEATLADLTLRAPFTGTITVVAVSVGEMVQPGQAVLTLADLSRLQVETTDLSERDVSRVRPGQAATVFIEALGAEFPGHVVRIAPQATLIGGDVVYPVIVELEGQPPGARWGMSAEVEIEAAE